MIRAEVRGVPHGPWVRPVRNGQKGRRLIIDGPTGATIAWIDHGNDDVAENIAAYIEKLSPFEIAESDARERAENHGV